MTKKAFLKFIFFEGILFTFLGLAMLIVPKVTDITFGLMLCITLFVAGLHKIINSITTKKYNKHFVLDIFLGVLLCSSGALLFMSPMFSMILITSLVGLYFLFESISKTAFAIQTRKFLYLWWASLFLAFLDFFLGLILIVGIPSTALWLAGIFVGLGFLITGMLLNGLYISTKYVYNY